jgi:hypothetical protein
MLVQKQTWDIDPWIEELDLSLPINSYLILDEGAKIILK